MYRSHSLLRLKRVTPGNKLKVHHARRKPSKARCPISGEILRGVPCLRPADIRKLPKSARRPNRPYGGKVASKVLAAAILSKVLSESAEQSSTSEK